MKIYVSNYAHRCNFPQFSTVMLPLGKIRSRCHSAPNFLISISTSTRVPKRDGTLFSVDTPGQGTLFRFSGRDTPGRGHFSEGRDGTRDRFSRDTGTCPVPLCPLLKTLQLSILVNKIKVSYVMNQ